MKVGNFVKTPLGPKVYGGCPNPKKMFDAIIEDMKWKNEKALYRIEEMMCECECECKYYCGCDEEDYCVGNHVPSYELIRECINYYYDITNYDERIKERQIMRETMRESIKKQKEEKEKMIRLNKQEKRKLKRKEKKRLINIKKAIDFIQVKYNLK